MSAFPNTLHYIPGSPPARALMMTCRLLNLDVTFRETMFPKKENLEDWFVKMNPRHCVPTLDYKGFAMWESRASMKYLVDTFGEDDLLYPRDRKQRFVVDRQLDYDLGHVFRAVTQFVNPLKFMLKPADSKDEAALKVILKSLDDLPEIRSGGYMAGDHMTLADISLLATLTFLECIHYDVTIYEYLTSWMERLKKEIPCYDEVNKCWDEWIVFSETQTFRDRMIKRMKDLGLN